MKSVFAVISDVKDNFLVGKRYDSDESFYFLGGTIFSEDNSDLNALIRKIEEKSSFVFTLDQVDRKSFELYDGKRRFDLQLLETFENRDQKFYFFATRDDFSPHIDNWRRDFQENQIQMVNYVISKVREIAPYISFVDWIYMMVIYKGKYRDSASFEKLLKKRGASSKEVEEIISYMEILDIYLRYQNLSLVKFEELIDRNGLINSQRDFFRLLDKK